MTSTATSRRTASSPAPVRSCSAGLAASHAALPASQVMHIWQGFKHPNSAAVSA